MKKILLTGATGFLGSEFLNFISKDSKFQITDIRRSKIKSNKLKNHKTIIFKSYPQLSRDLNNKKFDIFINFATFYNKTHTLENIDQMINSNILFPNYILEKVGKNLKMFITFGSMMEYSGQNAYKPQNYYSSTKKAFESVIEFYKLKFKKCKFYNIKLYETFGNNDKRNKLLPLLLKTHQKNTKIKIVNKNLTLNVILSDDLNLFLKKLICKNLKSYNLILQNKKNLKILNLIKKINSNNLKKIKYKFGNIKTYNKFPTQISGAKILKIQSNIEKFFLGKINGNKKNKIQRSTNN